MTEQRRVIAQVIRRRWIIPTSKLYRRPGTGSAHLALDRLPHAQPPVRGSRPRHQARFQGWPPAETIPRRAPRPPDRHPLRTRHRIPQRGRSGHPGRSSPSGLAIASSTIVSNSTRPPKTDLTIMILRMLSCFSFYPGATGVRADPVCHLPAGAVSPVLTMLFHRVGCTFLGLRPRHRQAGAGAGRRCSVQPHFVDRHHRHRLGRRRYLCRQQACAAPSLSASYGNAAADLFVDYNSRVDTKRSSTEMARDASRAMRRCCCLPKAIATSARVCPALPLGAGRRGAGGDARWRRAADVAIQPVTIAYTHLQGLPVSRTEQARSRSMPAASSRGEQPPSPPTSRT